MCDSGSQNWVRNSQRPLSLSTKVLHIRCRLHPGKTVYEGFDSDSSAEKLCLRKNNALTTAHTTQHVVVELCLHHAYLTTATVVRAPLLHILSWGHIRRTNRARCCFFCWCCCVRMISLPSYLNSRMKSNQSKRSSNRYTDAKANYFQTNHF